MRHGCTINSTTGLTNFSVWAPDVESMDIILADGSQPAIPMQQDSAGYWTGQVRGLSAGSKYWFQLNGTTLRPDPASHAQPDGVHGPSQIVDHTSFRWTDRKWKGLPLEKLVLYELHVGTFTPEGTFEAIIPRLADLRSLGVTAIELMPVSPFPGHRNWGYDGTHPFAVQQSYGGPAGLRKLVDACHGSGLAVFLDVVYNHLGPEGNYLGQYAPFFTERYRTPWGMAMNFDGPDSNEVRSYFIQNAQHWLERYHLDGLRLDAVHAIFDQNAIPFLRELSDHIASYRTAARRHIHLVAESDLNDPRMIRPAQLGGLGMDAQWSDDFHHALHALLTGERSGYYADFGELQHLATALREGFVYAGQYSQYRRRRHGDSVLDRSPSQLVIACQTHDQIGNRKQGDRLATLVSFEALKLSRTLHLLSPYVPLLFMGEEYAEKSPFLYFVSHTDAALIEAVRNGRREEFAGFGWDGELPDPQAPETFIRSCIAWETRETGMHHSMLEFTRTLLTLRRTLPALRPAGRESMVVHVDSRRGILGLHRRSRSHRTFMVCNFKDTPYTGRGFLPPGRWKRVLDSSDLCWEGPGSLTPPVVQGSQKLRLHPFSALVLTR